MSSHDRHTALLSFLLCLALAYVVVMVLPAADRRSEEHRAEFDRGRVAEGKRVWRDEERDFPWARESWVRK